MYIEGLDDIDNTIISLLLEDARMSYSDIAQKVGLSRVAVKNRIDGLEKQGVILGYKAVIDQTASQEGRIFFMDIITEPEDFNQIIQEISQYDIVKKVYAVTGESRIRVEGYVASNKKYENFMRTLKSNLDGSLQGIKSLTIQDVLYTYKDSDKGICNY